MADIRISDGFNSNLVSSGIGSTGNGFRDTKTRFYIMKGTIPTQGELDAAGANFRSADRLVFLNSSTIGDSLTTVSGNVITLTYHEASATATATATWFYWDGDTNESASTPLSRVVGSISDLNGNGDLKMTDINIIGGNVYGIGPVTLTLPQSYTYA